MSFIKRMLGDPNERELKKIQPIVDEINSLEEDITSMTDDELRARTAEFREQLATCSNQEEEDEMLDDMLPEAFAMVREASRRTIGQRHFDVQLIGGIVLHQGKIAEMRTGEGKTLVATLPSYLNALTGRGVHVVTVNDYLAKLHAEWMGQIHRYLGLSVGVILSGPENQNPIEKRAAYAADITYGTNNEYGFDYLRDNMVPDLSYCVQRQLNFAIVDEVDNILIDEARTPLIISAPSAESADTYVKFAQVVKHLKEGVDFVVELKTRTVAINDQGIDTVEAALGLQNIYGNMELTRYLENALKAHAIMHLDVDYVVENGEVIIVDEHTGRKMFGRRYNEGLHQAIEAKEGVPILSENRTVATITFQNYFRIYHKLAGMTGTALTEAQEFDKIYKLDVVQIPTNKTMIRDDETDLIFKSEEAKFNAVVAEIRQYHALGQPILVGTTSVEKSEYLASKLDLTGIDYEILNAKNHAREAQIITQAGRSGAVTISTNMAGRGTDILLGGNPEGMIDQIFAEQGIEKEFATEGDYAEALMLAKQRCAEDHDKVVALGGLYVIGTERHDSRRIDNQLRGRAGRQGDPGTSRFYISLEDDLMRRFGSDRVANLMNFLKMEDDVPIESNMASKMIEQAQQKVEAWYFDIRKHVVEYDDVIARQREVIYADRQAILAQEGLHERILDMIQGEVEELVDQNTGGNLAEHWNFDAIVSHFDRWQMPLSDDFFPENINSLKRHQLKEQCIAWAREHYDAKHQRLADELASFGEPPEKAEELTAYLEKDRMLHVVDSLWMEHIDNLDELRTSIGLRGIAQTDPLVEFKREGFSSFEALKQQIRRFVVDNVILSEIKIAVQQPIPPVPLQHLSTNADSIAQALGQSKTETSPQDRKPVSRKPMTQTAVQKKSGHTKTQTRPLGSANGKTQLHTENGGEQDKQNESHHGTSSQHTGTKTATRPIVPVAVFPKVGPNDPCPCGSKQKYKFCHGVKK